MPAFSYRNTRASKLTPTTVRQLREMYQTGQYTQGDLGRIFQITAVQVGRIIRGESWQQLPQPPAVAADHDATIAKAIATQREVDIAAGRPPSVFESGDLPEGAEETDGSALERMARAVHNKSADALTKELKNLPVSDTVKEQADKFLGGKKDDSSAK